MKKKNVNGLLDFYKIAMNEKIRKHIHTNRESEEEKGSEIWGENFNVWKATS